MHLVPAGPPSTSVVQIFLYHGGTGPSVIFSFLLLGSKCSQETEKEKKLAEACKFSLNSDLKL